MPVKKHSVEQIIAKLREIEKLTAQGLSIPLAAKKVGVTDQTFYRWRIRYGSLKEEEAKRLARWLARLCRIVSRPGAGRYARRRCATSASATISAATPATSSVNETGPASVLVEGNALAAGAVDMFIARVKLVSCRPTVCDAVQIPVRHTFPPTVPTGLHQDSGRFRESFWRLDWCKHRSIRQHVCPANSHITGDTRRFRQHHRRMGSHHLPAIGKRASLVHGRYDLFRRCCTGRIGGLDVEPGRDGRPTWSRSGHRDAASRLLGWTILLGNEVADALVGRRAS